MWPRFCGVCRSRQHRADQLSFAFADSKCACRCQQVRATHLLPGQHDEIDHPLTHALSGSPAVDRVAAGTGEVDEGHGVGVGDEGCGVGVADDGTGAGVVDEADGEGCEDVHVTVIGIDWDVEAGLLTSSVSVPEYMSDAAVTESLTLTA